MGEGLLSLWKLGAPVQPATASDAQGVTAFRDAIASVNASLQSAITAAPTEQHAALAADRGKLYEAYQVASSRFAEDETAGKDAMLRVAAAAGTLLSKAATATAEGAEAKQQWAKRQADFDDALRQIGELEEANHPKSANLRQVAESIRQLIGQQQFGASVAAFDALAPKLAELVGQQIEAQTPTAGDPSTTSNLATLEVRVSYQGAAVPGAMVRLTGPTKSPDTSTDAAGVAQFVGIEPGKYYVNAAKQAFVFQPAQVPQDALTPGAVYTANITKAAQGQPPAPGYLYSGGGAAKPTTPPSPPNPPQPTKPVSPSDPSQPTDHQSPPTGLATVEIHVIDEKGAPAEQAMVRISTGPTTPPDAKSSAAGIARFQLVPGEYHVNAAKRDIVWQPAYIAAGALQPGATYPVTLNKPHYPTPDGDTSSLSVHVTWDDGVGVNEARVDIDGNPKYSAPTDSNGFARFDKLPVGPHSIQATHVSLEYGTVSRSATATVTKDKNVTETIRLSKHANLCSIGVLISWKREDGMPSFEHVEGAIVTIDPSKAPPVVTNTQGQASFRGLPAGTYTVTAIIPATGQSITARNVTVVLDQGSRSQHETVLMHANRNADPTNPEENNNGDLSVEVRREGSELDAVGAIVSLSPAVVPPQMVTTSGRVRFDKVPVGDYTVTAELVQEVGTKSAASARVAVNANVYNTTGLMLASSIAGGDLVVFVVDESGKGLDYVLVILNEGVGSELTNLNGQAEFKNLPPRSYVVSAHPDTGKYDVEPSSGTAEIKAGRSQTLRLTMAAKNAPAQNGTINVTVTTPGNKDLDFTVVSISPNVHAPQMAGTGRVQFRDVPVGEYVVEATLNAMVARQHVRLEASGGLGGFASAHLVLSKHDDSGDSIEDLVIA